MKLWMPGRVIKSVSYSVPGRESGVAIQTLIERGKEWLQLYVNKDRDITKRIIKHAGKSLILENLDRID